MLPKEISSDDRTEEIQVEVGVPQLPATKNKTQSILKQSFSNGIKLIMIPMEEQPKTSCCWRLCCCCYYLFCCCCCCESGDPRITKTTFVNRFQKWVHLGHRSGKVHPHHMEDPLTLLIRLYAHDVTAIEALEKVRVNPDYTSQFRSDLEFFIPQICAFYLRGDSDNPERLINLLVMAATSSFFFSHRIWFYFQSMIFNTSDNSSMDVMNSVKEQYKRTRVALNGIREACCQGENKERLYLSNSSEIVAILKELKLINKLPQLREDFQIQSQNVELPSNNQNNYHQNPGVQPQVNPPQTITRSQKVKTVIELYNKGEFKQENHSLMIGPQDIILQPFLAPNEDNKEPDPNKQGEGSYNERFHIHYALVSYLSTPKFIMALTDISQALVTIQGEERKAYLQQALAKINSKLPASAYIPFVNSSIRNYCVLHIAADETKVFQTKERAPLLLCIEAYRPEELSLVREEKRKLKVSKKQKPKNHYLKSTNDLISPEYDNYRSYSWNSSSQTITTNSMAAARKNSQSQDHLQAPLLENPYLTKEQQHTGKSQKQLKNIAEEHLDQGDHHRKSQKKVTENNKEEVAQEVIRLSDIKVSNPLTIDDVRRTESGLIEKIKVSEVTFKASMRQASSKFKDQLGKQVRQNSGCGSDMEAIMEVEDDKTQNPNNNNTKPQEKISDDHLNFFSCAEDNIEEQKDQQKKSEFNLEISYSNAEENQMPKNPLLECAKKESPSIKDSSEGKQEGNSPSIDNTYHSQDNMNYLAAAGNGEDDNTRYSNMIREKSVFKSYGTGGVGSRMTGERKESQDAPELGSSSSSKPKQEEVINNAHQGMIMIESIEEKPQDEEEQPLISLNPKIIEEELKFAQENGQFNSRRSYSVHLPGTNQNTHANLNKSTTPSQSQHNTTKVNNQIQEEQPRLLKAEDFAFPEDYDPSKHRPSNAAFYEERPVTTLFSETSKEQDERVRRNSPFGYLKTWRLIKIIVKSNDDVRQEQFAMQLISQIDQIFKLKKLQLWLRPYEILATGKRCGLIEVCSDALSIDSIKRKLGQQARLLDYFTQQFGVDPKAKLFRKAQDNFCRSLAAYSLVCYILQVKDRHNGNILIDIEGHIMHIDFGFLLSNAPGKGIKFEQAPFKLTQEMVEVLGGIKSKRFKEFRELMRLGFMAIQEHADRIIKLVEMMFMGLNDLPCFVLGENLIGDLKNRILPPIDNASKTKHKGTRLMNEVEAARYVDTLIQSSFDNWRTKAYDKFQYCCQGIL